MTAWEPLARRRYGEWLAQVPIEGGRLCRHASVHSLREQLTQAAGLR